MSPGQSERSAGPTPSQGGCHSINTPRFLSVVSYLEAFSSGAPSLEAAFGRKSVRVMLGKRLAEFDDSVAIAGVVGSDAR